MRILVFQHHHAEHPGSLRYFWQRDGHSWDSVRLDLDERIPDLDAYDVLVVTGGEMDVWQEDAHPWLAAEKQAIRHWVADLERPFLGICLGHQLLAEALGGHVGPMPAPEVGLFSVNLTSFGQRDPLFAAFPAVIETFQWHGAHVVRCPEGAEVLAENAASGVQAFRWGRHAYGLQFHIEATEVTIGDWQAIPEYQASLEEALGPDQAAALAKQMQPRLPALRDAAERINGAFFSGLENRRETVLAYKNGPA